jgi:hypothetical protein
MLSLGSSRHWADTLETLTGERKLDAGALLEYFAPLQEWLLKTNKELGVQIGWELSDSKIFLYLFFAINTRAKLLLSNQKLIVQICLNDETTQSEWLHTHI